MDEMGGTAKDWLRAGTCVRLLIPSTKQIPSRILDLPEPFRPVMALN